jgi:hypothetical protein
MESREAMKLLLLLALAGMAVTVGPQNVPEPKVTHSSNGDTTFTYGTPVELPQSGNVTFQAPVDLPMILISCPSAEDKKRWWAVKDCPAADGWTVTMIMNNWGEQMDAVSHCGDWGPWILDKQGNVMGKYRNPPCPKGKP